MQTEPGSVHSLQLLVQGLHCSVPPSRKWLATQVLHLRNWSPRQASQVLLQGRHFFVGESR